MQPYVFENVLYNLRDSCRYAEVDNIIYTNISIKIVFVQFRSLVLGSPNMDKDGKV